MLIETFDDDYFSLNGNDDTSRFNDSQISADGYETNGDEFGDPLMTDKYAGMISPQNRLTRFGGVRSHCLKEDDESNINKHDIQGSFGVPDGVTDTQNLDDLSDGDDTNDQMVIPKTVDDRVELLINTCKGLTAKQCAMVLNRVIEGLNLKGMPIHSQRELMTKIKANAN